MRFLEENLKIVERHKDNLSPTLWYIIFLQRFFGNLLNKLRKFFCCRRTFFNFPAKNHQIDKFREIGEQIRSKSKSKRK